MQRLGLPSISKKSDNTLTGYILDSFGNLMNLTKLHLFQNQLSGQIPQKLGHLMNLENLDLSNNTLTGTMPNNLGGLKKMKVFPVLLVPLETSE
jgi:Leucine-rich repeat (LRR) protein